MSLPESCLPHARPGRSRAVGVAAAMAALATLLLALLGHEARLVPRLREKLAPRTRPWTAVDASSVAAVRAETRRQLDALPPVARLGARPGLRAEEDLAGWRRGRTVNSWANACLAQGVLMSLEAATDPAEEAALARFGARLVDGAGGFVEPLHGVEQAMVGPVLLRLEAGHGGARFRQAAVRLADFLMGELRRTSTGTLPYSPERPEICLVDTLAMACPFLAGAEVRLGKAGGADLAARQLLEFVDRAVDPATGLPWHAYSAAGGPAYGILGWTRGAGWLAVGLAETLAALPESHAARPRLAAALDRLVAAAAARQGADGAWRWCLGMPEGEADMSGTAMLAWAIERGVRSGALPADRRGVARRAVEAVVRRTDQRGLVGQALGECQAVGHYPRQFGAYPWAQGPAAAALAWALAPIPSPGSIPTADPAGGGVP